jgi:hypothetical protein
MVLMSENAPTAPATPGKAKRSMLPVLVMVFALLGVVLMGASLTMTWYTTKVETKVVEGGPTPYTADENFNGYVTDGKSQAWADMNNVNQSHAMYGQVQMLVIAGLVTAALLMVGGLMLMFRPKLKLIVAVLGILAIVFTLLGPVVFMARHAPAWDADAKSSAGEGPQSSFSGMTDVSGVKDTWGPNTGWTVALLGFVFTLIGAIMVFAVKGARKAG